MADPPRLVMVAVLVAALGQGGQAAAQVVSVTLQPPARDFGVFVGDLLTSTATIRVLPGTTLDRSSLPAEGPVSPSVDVRRVRVTAGRARIEISVTYQSFFSPEQVSGGEVPGYAVAVLAHGQRLKAAVPGFGFTASTFRHDLQPTLDSAALRPDHAPAQVRAPVAAWEVAGGLLIMACAVLGLAWPRFSARQAPFRRAARELSRLSRTPGRDAGCEAMLVLHRAFDATAGRRLFADDVDDFVRRHRHFLPLRAPIATFFEMSRAAFFGTTGEVPAAAAWAGLCRDLSRAEGRR